MFTNHFGIEMEFTGITRKQAAEVAAKFLGGTMTHAGGYYGTYHVTAPDGRIWKFMSSCIRTWSKPLELKSSRISARKSMPLPFASRARKPLKTSLHI